MRWLLPVLMFSTVASGCAFLRAPTLDEEMAAEAEAHKAEIHLVEQLKQHYEAGDRLYHEGKLDQAEVEFKAMLALKPEEENALYRLGNIAFKQSEYAKSADYFERAIKVNPRNAKAHYNLASIRLMQSQEHFKYYAALADPKADLSKVSRLLANIEGFASKDKKTEDPAFLDRIAGALKK